MQNKTDIGHDFAIKTFFTFLISYNFDDLSYMFKIFE